MFLYIGVLRPRNTIGKIFCDAGLRRSTNCKVCHRTVVINWRHEAGTSKCELLKCHWDFTASSSLCKHAQSMLTD